LLKIESYIKKLRDVLSPQDFKQAYLIFIDINKMTEKLTKSLKIFASK